MRFVAASAAIAVAVAAPAASGARQPTSLPSWCAATWNTAATTAQKDAVAKRRPTMAWVFARPGLPGSCTILVLSRRGLERTSYPSDCACGQAPSGPPRWSALKPYAGGLVSGVLARADGHGRIALLRGR